jgi:hypothetical protein
MSAERKVPKAIPARVPDTVLERINRPQAAFVDKAGLDSKHGKAVASVDQAEKTAHPKIESHDPERRKQFRKFVRWVLAANGDEDEQVEQTMWEWYGHYEDLLATSIQRSIQITEDVNKITSSLDLTLVGIQRLKQSREDYMRQCQELTTALHHARRYGREDKLQALSSDQVDG